MAGASAEQMTSLEKRVDDGLAALESRLNGSLQGTLSSAITALKTELDQAVPARMEAQKVEMGKAVSDAMAGSRNEVDAVVSARLADLDGRIQKICDDTIAQFTASQAQGAQLVETLRASVDAMGSKLEATSDGKLAQVAEALSTSAAREEGRMVYMRAEISQLAAELRGAGLAMQQEIVGLTTKVETIEHMPTGGGGNGGDRAARGSRLRVPDPSGWKIEILKKDDNFPAWRETFDLQAGSIWHGIEDVQEAIRDSKNVVTNDGFYEICKTLDFDPPANGANIEDWNYLFLSKKLYMVLHTYASTDVRKIISESARKCGFEAYRLLGREFDPIASDTAYTLLERVLVIVRWNVKGVDEEVSALREAIKRFRELERRCGDQGQAQRKIISGMLYANVLSPSTRKHILNCKDVERAAPEGDEKLIVPVRDDLEAMKEAVEQLKALEEKSKLAKMDVSALSQKV